jgi:hypothetical protein
MRKKNTVIASNKELMEGSKERGSSTNPAEINALLNTFY